jgi:hypothetical protein
MDRISSAVMRWFRWFFLSDEAQEIGEDLSERLLSLPEYEFRPSIAFRSGLGEDVCFNVTNPLDLLLQEQGLMASALVVEMVADGRTSTAWFRFDPEELSTRGASRCFLFADDAGGRFDGVCGVVCNRKRS